MTDEISKTYDWTELHVSKELADLGKNMDSATKLTGAQELKESLVEIRKDYFHALSLQKEGPSEEGLTATDNGEARVANRAAIASSVADTNGITGAEKQQLIAEAEAKERVKVMDVAKKQEEVLQKKLDDAKSQREAAEKKTKDAEDKHKVAVAVAERQRAEMQAELQRTRNREKIELEAKAKLEAILLNVRRKRDNDEAIDVDDLGDAPAPKKRKNAEEKKEERLQKLIEKAGDEEEGRRLYTEKEEERERKAGERAAARLVEQRQKLCKEIEEERAALSTQLEKQTEVREKQDEELQHLRKANLKLEAKIARAKAKKASASASASDDAQVEVPEKLAYQLGDLNDKLAAETFTTAYLTAVCEEMKKATNIDDEEFNAIKTRVLAEKTRVRAEEE